MTEQSLQDAILRHSLQILRLSAGEQAEVQKIMVEMTKELRALLNSTDLPASSKRDVEALIKEAEKVIEVGYNRAGASADTTTLAIIVAEKTQEIIEDTIPLAVKLPTEAVLHNIGNDVLIDGAPSSAWWAKQSEDTAFRFGAQVRQGIVNGESQQQIVARVIGRGGEPGILDRATQNARALVHSSVMTAANRARLEVFRKNARIFSGVRWLATLDSHTCRTCGALDGQAWNLDGEKIKGTTVTFQAPPAHFGCRCVLSGIPARRALEAAFPGIGAEIDAASRRASSAGPVHGATTFNDFLARQSDEFVNETLGKRRADMFRAGSLTVRDLVSGTGRELTLSELRKQ